MEKTPGVLLTPNSLTSAMPRRPVEFSGPMPRTRNLNFANALFMPQPAVLGFPLLERRAPEIVR